MVPLGVSFSLQIEDQGLIRVHLSPILDLFDSFFFFFNCHMTIFYYNMFSVLMLRGKNVNKMKV